MAAGMASPEVHTMCPRPRRIGGPCADRDSQMFDSPNTMFVDACDKELRELLDSGAQEGYNKLLQNRSASAGGSCLATGCSGQQETRPLSSISTSAGPTPSPEGRQTPLVENGSHRRDTKDVRDNRDSQAARPLTNTHASQVQKKVFVGGIPQEMSQDDLFKLFSEYGGLKKAWLQRYRESGRPKSHSQHGHNHRGFGFVIFQDAAAVDKLLGDNQSCFLPLKDGKKLEVKRAVSSHVLLPSSNEPWESPQQPRFDMHRRAPGPQDSPQQLHQPSHQQPQNQQQRHNNQHPQQHQQMPMQTQQQPQQQQMQMQRKMQLQLQPQVQMQFCQNQLPTYQPQLGHQMPQLPMVPPMPGLWPQHSDSAAGNAGMGQWTAQGQMPPNGPNMMLASMPWAGEGGGVQGANMAQMPRPPQQVQQQRQQQPPQQQPQHMQMQPVQNMHMPTQLHSPVQLPQSYPLQGASHNVVPFQSNMLVWGGKGLWSQVAPMGQVDSMSPEMGQQAGEYSQWSWPVTSQSQISQ